MDVHLDIIFGILLCFLDIDAETIISNSDGFYDCSEIINNFLGIILK